MCAVPLVIDRIYKGIQENVNSKGEFFRYFFLQSINFLLIILRVMLNYSYFRKLMEYFYQYKSYYRSKGMDTPLLDAIIFKKMRAIIGGRVRYCYIIWKTFSLVINLLGLFF